MTAIQTARTTLITPIKNEMTTLSEFWESIQSQNLMPSEWILLDNGSEDGSLEWLREKTSAAATEPSSRLNLIEVKILSFKNGSVGHALNEGVAVASNDLIACCRADTTIGPNWLSDLTMPLRESAEADVVSGVWQAAGQTRFAKWYGKIVGPNLKNLNPDFYLPTTRSMAFSKAAWKEAGGFPEWLPHVGEDTLFGLRARAKGLRLQLAIDAKVDWHPQRNFWQVLHQEKQYIEANLMIGLAKPDLTVFVRPWLAFFFGVFLLPVSFWASFLSVVMIVLIDAFRLHFMRNRKSQSFLMTLFTAWVMPLAWQWASLGAMGYKTREVGPPEKDKEAVREFLKDFLESLNRGKP